MRATGWHGGPDPDKPAGYGLRFSEADRDRTFSPGWTEVVIHLEGAGSTTIELSPSFWRSCSELRSAHIGRWLMAEGVAPWAKGDPPGIAVDHIEGNRFKAKVSRSRRLI